MVQAHKNKPAHAAKSSTSKRTDGSSSGSSHHSSCCSTFLLNGHSLSADPDQVLPPQHGAPEGLSSFFILHCSSFIAHRSSPSVPRPGHQRQTDRLETPDCHSTRCHSSPSSNRRPLNAHLQRRRFERAALSSTSASLALGFSCSLTRNPRVDIQFRFSMPLRRRGY